MSEHENCFKEDPNGDEITQQEPFLEKESEGKDIYRSYPNCITKLIYS